MQFPAGLFDPLSKSSSKSSASSSSASYVTLANTGVPAASDPDGLTYSPFDSPRDDSFGFSSSGGCGEFKQNPFKPQGFCNNCFKLHY